MVASDFVAAWAVPLLTKSPIPTTPPMTQSQGAAEDDVSASDAPAEEPEPEAGASNSVPDDPVVTVPQPPRGQASL